MIKNKLEKLEISKDNEILKNILEDILKRYSPKEKIENLDIIEKE